MSTSLNPSMTHRRYSWAAWKAVNAAKGGGRHQYDGDDGITYLIWIYDGPEILMCSIYQGVVPDEVINAGYSQAQNDADKADFEANFKPTANSSTMGRSGTGDMTTPPYGYYFAATTMINGSASAQNLLSIENPAGSLTNLYIKRMSITAILTANTAVAFAFHCARTTGLPTGGTVQTAQKQASACLDPNAIIRQAPAATLAAGRIWTSMPAIPVQIGIPATGFAGGPTFHEAIFDAVPEEFIILAPGEGLMVMADANAAVWRHRVRVLWSEALF
jgi:hypothetical protein